MAVTTSFYPNQRTHSQVAVEPLRISISVYQLVFDDLSGLRIENRYLLKAGMKITPYNLHRRLLLVPDQYQSSTGTHRIIAEAFDLIQSMFAQRTWAENGFFQCFHFTCNDPAFAHSLSVVVISLFL